MILVLDPSAMPRKVVPCISTPKDDFLVTVADAVENVPWLSLRKEFAPGT
jgi:hypothetical protein